jgi:hypothetical protein
MHQTENLAPMVQSVDAVALKAIVMLVRIVLGAPTSQFSPTVRMAQSGRRARSRVSLLQVRILLRTPHTPA